MSTEMSNGYTTDLLVTTLGDLPGGTIITRKRLAKMLERHEVSIDRAVKRGELPPPVRFCGAPTWTVKAIMEHLNNRLAKAAKEVEKDSRRLHALHP